MSKLILASFGLRSPVLRKKYQEAMTVTADSKILIIPFAVINQEATAAIEKKAATDLGFSEENIVIANENNCSELDFSVFDYIYVTGGNVFRLLKAVDNAGIKDKIREAVYNGTTYIGESAGVYLACEDLKYAEYLDNNECDSGYEGLGFTGRAVICHFSYERFIIYKLCKDMGLEIETIKDDEIAVVNGDEWRNV